MGSWAIEEKGYFPQQLIEISTVIGGEPASIFYESEALEITSQTMYCFGKDQNNNITPPLTSIALKVTGV